MVACRPRDASVMTLQPAASRAGLRDGDKHHHQQTSVTGGTDGHRHRAEHPPVTAMPWPPTAPFELSMLLTADFREVGESPKRQPGIRKGGQHDAATAESRRCDRAPICSPLSSSLRRRWVRRRRSTVRRECGGPLIVWVLFSISECAWSPRQRRAIHHTLDLVGALIDLSDLGVTIMRSTG